jgi:hypothetical protein
LKHVEFVETAEKHELGDFEVVDAELTDSAVDIEEPESTIPSRRCTRRRWRVQVSYCFVLVINHGTNATGLNYFNRDVFCMFKLLRDTDGIAQDLFIEFMNGMKLWCTLNVSI